MENKIYPDLQDICRLCLKENAGTVYIFPKEKNSDKYASLSIPMRIMTCAALEVQESDGFPKKICVDCRLQLEKSYYFRKQSQASDAKLRKHIRLIGMGKISKVFVKKVDDDDDGEELEFKDALDFINEQEDRQKQNEKLKIDNLINEIKLQNEEELEKIRESLKAKCREELIPQIREEAKKELQNEMEETIKTIREQCLKEAKESLRDECRQLEIKSLLDELHIFLTRKKKSLETTEGTHKIIKTRSLSPINNNCPAKKSCLAAINSSKIEIVHVEQEFKNQNVEKENTSDRLTEEDANVNDEECDSEGNFFIYDTDDCFNVEKTSEDKEDYANNDVAEEEIEDDDFVDSNSMVYTRDENVDTNEESRETSTTYRIEDNENGEIQFLKKSNENVNKIIDEENIGQSNGGNIVIINFPEEIENEFVEEFEEVKYLKSKKHSASNSEKLSDKHNVSATPSTVTRTTATLEATFLTKTYVNPLQRSTDTPKIFKCENCPMVFSTKPSLERHLRTHQKVEKTGITYQCPECHIVVSCSSALRRHMYVHCDEKPFTCNECGKSFVQKEILKRHMQTHTGIKPYQCTHCDRAFAQRINLTQHINRNHLEEPRIQQHPCHLCPKRFNHASGLSRHLASHSGVAFQCSECDRTFGDRSSIKRHIANMHGIGKSTKSDAK